MVTAFDIVYYVIYSACLITSFAARKSSIPGLFYLRLLLLAGIISEIIVEFLQHYQRDDNLPYYFYIPLEYILLLCFYAKYSGNKLFIRSLVASGVLYILIYFYLAIYRYGFTGYPSIIYNLSCFLNTIWISLLLFNLNILPERRIWAHPVFIIFSAFLIFFAGIFFFNAGYPLLLKRNTQLAASVRNYTNIVINYILYLLLAVGFLCSGKIRNY